MVVGFNPALFIFRPQLLSRFSEKDEHKTGILAIVFPDLVYSYIYRMWMSERE